ncbi:MAG TPA: endolytic transglycosylase MltG [Bryobacteraceae bacterium]|nr:endolytic transglycosylase MltG [Bryobacteraceae bacterium]
MSRRRGCRGCLARLFLFSFVLVLLAAGGIYVSIEQPYRAFEGVTFIELERGTGTRGIAQQLAGKGVIRYPWQFLIVRALRSHAALQAGEYRFDRPASVWTVYDRIARGDVFYYEITVPEGANMFDIASSIEQLGLLSRNDFLAAARDPQLIHDLAPQAPTLEGYLFPSTYRLTRHMTAAQICRLMTDTFRKHWQQLPKPDRPASVHEIVTLASLVEKETGLPDERPTVASVYLNRLRTGMPLDCDPTTIYAALLENRYRGTIYRSDLDSDNAYNTYKHAGLPPGPVANPGAASLRAAIQPADTQYLYFVARPDGSGGHHFSSTMAEHEKAVQAYRRGQR